MAFRKNNTKQKAEAAIASEIYDFLFCLSSDIVFPAAAELFI